MTPLTSTMRVAQSWRSCPRITLYATLSVRGKGIQFGKKLGQGVYGSVYDIVFADNPTKIKYVVKQVRASVDEETYYGSPITVGQLARLRTDVSRDLFISLNGGIAERLIRDGDKYMIPSYSIDCMTTSPQEFALTSLVQPL